MLGRAEVTELEHLPEHRDAAPGHAATRASASTAAAIDDGLAL